MLLLPGRRKDMSRQREMQTEERVKARVLVSGRTSRLALAES
jgi:hypothetical protein